jgi:hypothetical protein
MNTCICHQLALLQERLQIAITIIDGLDTTISDEPSWKALWRKGDPKKLKYAVHTKGKLDKVVKDLDA